MSLSENLLDHLQNGDWKAARQELDQDTNVTGNPRALLESIEKGIDARQELLADRRLFKNDLRCLIREILHRGIKSEDAIRYSFDSKSEVLGDAIAQETTTYRNLKTQFEHQSLHRTDISSEKYWPFIVQSHRDAFNENSPAGYWKFLKNGLEQAKNKESERQFICAAFCVYFDEHPPTEDVGKLDLDLFTDLIEIFKENYPSNQPYPDIEEVTKPHLYRHFELNRYSEIQIIPNYNDSPANPQLVPDIYHQIWERGLEKEVRRFIADKLRGQKMYQERKIGHKEGYEETFELFQEMGIDPVTIIYHIIYDDRTPEGDNAEDLNQRTKEVISMALDHADNMDPFISEELVNYAEDNNKIGVLKYVLNSIERRIRPLNWFAFSDNDLNDPRSGDVDNGADKDHNGPGVI